MLRVSSYKLTENISIRYINLEIQLTSPMLIACIEMGLGNSWSLKVCWYFWIYVVDSSNNDWCEHWVISLHLFSFWRTESVSCRISRGVHRHHPLWEKSCFEHEIWLQWVITLGPSISRILMHMFMNMTKR